jgi:hypothetical protein
MRKDIKYFDEITETEYTIDVDFIIHREMYGEDADGNRGRMVNEIDWDIEAVTLNDKVVKLTDIKLKVRIIDFLEDWINDNGDTLMGEYWGE